MGQRSNGYSQYKKIVLTSTVMYFSTPHSNWLKICTEVVNFVLNNPMSFFIDVMYTCALTKIMKVEAKFLTKIQIRIYRPIGTFFKRTSYDSKRKLERAQFMSDFELEMYHFRSNHAQSFLVRVWKWKFCIISSQFTFLVGQL